MTNIPVKALVERLRVAAAWLQDRGAEELMLEAADMILSLQRRAEAAEARVAELERGWQPIETRPRDDSQFLACTADGRVMIFNGVILDHIMAEGDRAPKHLQFPATHWMPLPAPPAPVGV